MVSRYQLLPPLTDEEYTELEADIVANGVLQPILVDEHGVPIDGHHRKQIAEKHGLRCPTIRCAPNLTDEQKRTLALGTNLHRRHLSREQKRAVIAASLTADPQLSDRQHAERVGASPTTVGDVRSDLEAGGELSKLDSRTGADGRARPAHVTTTTRTTESTKVERDIDVETGEILHGPLPVSGDPDAVEAHDFANDSEFQRLANEALDALRPRAEPAATVPGPTVSEKVLGAIHLVYQRLLNSWPADYLAGELDQDVVDGALDLARSVNAWAAAIEQSHPRGLRVMQGGRS